MRTRVKICGITRAEDAIKAAELGVDALGLVFYEKSKRHLSIEKAQELISAIPAFVSVVGLFLDPEDDYVREVCASVELDTLQFHGKESPEQCGSYGLPFIKAIGMRDNISLPSMAALYPKSRGFLVDSHAHGEAGGTGETFNWSSLEKDYDFPLILAGGLGPENVAEAIATVRPWAVDLSSGVESAPGVKDHAKMAALMNEVKRVNCES